MSRMGHNSHPQRLPAGSLCHAHRGSIRPFGHTAGNMQALPDPSGQVRIHGDFLSRGRIHDPFRRFGVRAEGIAAINHAGIRRYSTGVHSQRDTDLTTDVLTWPW